MVAVLIVAIAIAVVTARLGPTSVAELEARADRQQERLEARQERLEELLDRREERRDRRQRG